MRGGDKKILENLETCGRHTLYPRFCTCISCTVIVVRPSMLASLFVTMFLIGSCAKYPERNRYLKRRRTYLLLDWLIEKLSKASQRISTKIFTLTSFTEILFACSF